MWIRKIAPVAAAAALGAAGCVTDRHQAEPPLPSPPSTPPAAMSQAAGQVRRGEAEAVQPAGLTERSGESAPTAGTEARGQAPAGSPVRSFHDVVIPTQAAQPSSAGQPAPPGGPARPGSEASPRELRPGVGEVFTPPAPVPPPPQGLKVLEDSRQALPPGDVITLEELEAAACQNNPTLVEAHAQIQAELGRAIQAGLWPNPQLRWRGILIGLNGTAGAEFGTIQQKIITAHKLDLSRSMFLHQAKAEEWNALAQEYRVLNGVRAEYFATLGQQEIVQIRRELLKNAEDLVVTTREAYNLGLRNQRDVHEANAALQESRLQLLLAENLLRQRWQTLMAMTGTDSPLRRLGGTLEGDVAPFEWDSVLQRTLAESPQVHAAAANYRAAQVMRKRAIVEPVPNFVIEGGVGYNYASNNTVGFTKVVMEVPVFDWNQGNIRLAESRMVRQRAEIDRVRLILQTEMAVLYNDYLTNLQHVRNYQEVILPELRKAYALTLDSYEDDRNTWFDVLIAQRAYYDARLVYVKSLIAWRQAEVLLIGYGLTGALAPSPNVPPEVTRVTSVD